MLITPEEALEIVLSNVRPLKARKVALGEALHCRLAGAIRGDRDQPPTDRSSMDGYAVRTVRPARLWQTPAAAQGAAGSPAAFSAWSRVRASAASSVSG